MRIIKKFKKLFASNLSPRVSPRVSRRKMRPLACEGLESRQLMAADLFNHNFVMPEDTDSNGSVSPLDALVVINAINASGANDSIDVAVDVDADGALSPLDALLVVNFLNRDSRSGIGEVSAVNVERRIMRIEQAIAEQTLPDSLELGAAQHLLAVLRAGGYPELGDRMLNGRLTSDDAMSDDDNRNEAEIARYVAEARMGMAAQVMDAQQLANFADTLESRLEVIGVSNETGLDVTHEIRFSEGMSMQQILELVEARLAEFDIDVDAALPERMDVLFSSIIERLRADGINEESIIEITNELRAVYESGTPITVELLDEAFTLFHADESEESPSEEDFFISDLTEKLRQAGFTEVIIATISSEIRTSYAAGQPLTIDQIMTRVMKSWQGWSS